jgi:hypothetical protein
MSDVALYILMYCDLPDMTGGKCAAQAAHASSMCTLQGEELIRADHSDLSPVLQRRLNEARRLYQRWKDSTTQGFGTTLVFRHMRDEDGFCNPLDIFTANHHTLWDVVGDPTYPYRDVDRQIKTMNTDTCAWFLADRADEKHRATLDSIHRETPFILF